MHSRSIRTTIGATGAAAVLLRAFSLSTGPAQAAPTCGGKAPTIVGTRGNDTLRGTPGDDVISGLGGNARLLGRGGHDILCGGKGYDELRSGPGAASHVWRRRPGPHVRHRRP